MRPVLLFPSRQHEDTENSDKTSYLVVYATADNTLSKLLQLSPKVMVWSQDCYIVSLTPTLSYWENIAKQHARSCFDLWQHILQSELKGHNMYAVLCAHPWPGLITVATMLELGIRGFYSWDTAYIQNIYRHFSWETWWQISGQYLNHTTEHGFENYSWREKTLKALGQLKKTAKRLACERPQQLCSLPDEQIRRRFGSVIQQLWQWSFVEPKKHKKDNLFPCVFPWHFYENLQKPTVKRHIDGHLESWQQIEEGLREDLNRLCFLKSFNQKEYTVELEWRLVLHNLGEIPVLISFRHPHSLPAEIPSQRTALLQIQYAFEEKMKIEGKKYIDIESPMPPIIAWSLSVESSLLPSNNFTLIFNELNQDHNELIQLENKLHIPLNSYKSIDHWIPEHAFANQGELEQKQHQKAMEAVGAIRPLFIYENPQSFEHKDTSAMWVFLERTMDCWWLTQGQDVGGACLKSSKDKASRSEQQQFTKVNEQRSDEDNAEFGLFKQALRRDYYSYVKGDKRYWVYRDADKKWYIHGIFS